MTDSIAAVEAALAELAKEVGHEFEHVKTTAHGRRAIDFIATFKPHILKEDLPEAAVVVAEAGDQRPLRGLRVGNDIFVQENQTGLYLAGLSAREARLGYGLALLEGMLEVDASARYVSGVTYFASCGVVQVTPSFDELICTPWSSIQPATS